MHRCSEAPQRFTDFLRVRTNQIFLQAPVRDGPDQGGLIHFHRTDRLIDDGDITKWMEG